MSDYKVLLEEIKQKAKELNNKSILNKVNKKSFKDDLESVISILDDLGLEINNKVKSTISSQKNVSFKISKALSQHYFTIYYVNLSTNNYVGYSTNNEYLHLDTVENGIDFFSDAVNNAHKVVYKDDIEKVINALRKDTLIKETENGKEFNLTYRLLMEEGPVYVSMKALKLNKDDDELIIGLSNVDEAKKREIDYINTIEKNVTYSNIAFALARQYFAIFYVDSLNNNYIEYSIDNDTKELKVISSGDNFYLDLVDIVSERVAPEDQNRVLLALDKNNIIRETEDDTIFSVVYKQMMNGTPVFVNLTAFTLPNDDNHFIFAVSNIDDQKKKDIEFQRKIEEERILARTDGLAKCQNKLSYQEAERLLNGCIQDGIISDLAIVVCDLNKLKQINDTLGHAEGDKYIKESVRFLSETFRNSNVYRIGGDEFAVILDGADFYKRDYLMDKIFKTNVKNLNGNGVVMAVGMASFDIEKDRLVQDVFKRADEQMYENKKYLKTL